MNTKLKQFRVLLIDDNHEVCEFVARYILKPNNMAVEMAMDGAEGLKKALAIQPDLILMAYDMPKLNGVEVLRELRKKNNRVPVILMTSHGSEKVAVEVFRLGVQDYIIKPFSISEMLDAIENALSVSRLERDKADLTRRIIQTNQQLERRLRELTVLYRIGQSITGLTHPDRMLDRIVDAMLYMVKGKEGSLVLVDSETGKFIEQIKKERNRTRETKKFKRLGLMSELSMAPAESNLYTSSEENFISAPLQVGQKVIGTLTVSKESKKGFTTHDDQLLRMLADYAAIAIHNRELLNKLHLKKEEEKQEIRNLFERYLAPSVVEQMLNQPEPVELGGKRKVVSVLFADIRGFSAFSNHTSPEILVELLNQYIRVAADAILAEGGTLDKFMGDAVMAFYNAPIQQPDHPIRAIRAAWTLCRSVERLHRHLIPAHRLHFGVGVGVGEAVVGNIGTPQMMNYTVIGDGVNKVKRLQENAKGGQILISQETYFLVQDEVMAKPIGQIKLKGQAHKEPIYEVYEVLDV